MIIVVVDGTIIATGTMPVVLLPTIMPAMSSTIMITDAADDHGENIQPVGKRDSAGIVLRIRRSQLRRRDGAWFSDSGTME